MHYIHHFDIDSESNTYEKHYSINLPITFTVPARSVTNVMPALLGDALGQVAEFLQLENSTLFTFLRKTCSKNLYNKHSVHEEVPQPDHASMNCDTRA